MPHPGNASRKAEQLTRGRVMTEGNDRQQASETGTENKGTDDEMLEKAATGGKGTNPAQGTPPIEGGGNPDQTQVPAADDDVGVPEELDERTD